MEGKVMLESRDDLADLLRVAEVAEMSKHQVHIPWMFLGYRDEDIEELRCLAEAKQNPAPMQR
jgi:hypothetical protein